MVRILGCGPGDRSSTLRSHTIKKKFEKIKKICYNIIITSEKDLYCKVLKISLHDIYKFRVCEILNKVLLIC